MPDGEDLGSEEIPAGWYPDPSPHRRPRERLWAGDEWTSWTRRVRADRVEDGLAGWRIDPTDPARERLWTGSQWTDHLRFTEVEEASTEDDSESAAVAAPLHPEFGSSGWYPDEERPQRQRFWDGEKWTDREREVPSASISVIAVESGTGPQGLGADFVAQLAELARLHQAGAITDSEFGHAKARLLGQV